MDDFYRWTYSCRPKSLTRIRGGAAAASAAGYPCDVRGVRLLRFQKALDALNCPANGPSGGGGARYTSRQIALVTKTGTDKSLTTTRKSLIPRANFAITPGT